MNAGRQKVEGEGKCRACPAPASQCDAAHLWPRSLGRKGFDEPDLIVPLCSVGRGGSGCHERFDAHKLDLLPHLTLDEQVAVVRACGSIYRAFTHLAGEG